MLPEAVQHVHVVLGPHRGVEAEELQKGRLHHAQIGSLDAADGRVVCGAEVDIIPHLRGNDEGDEQ